MALRINKGALQDSTSIFTMRNITADNNVSYVDFDFYLRESEEFAYELAVNDEYDEFTNKIYRNELMPQNADFVTHIWLMRN